MPDESAGFPPETGPLVMPADGIAATKALAYPVDGYAGGWRDSALSLAMKFEQRATDRHYPDELYRLAMRHAAELARQQATDEPCEPGRHEPVSPDPPGTGNGSGSLSPAPETIPLFDMEGTP
jgi:hypothetical protein